jgi:hypothetical protein
VDELDKRLVVFDARIEALEQTVEKLADSMLRMESILDEMAQLLLPESEQDAE